MPKDFGKVSRETVEVFEAFWWHKACVLRPRGGSGDPPLVLEVRYGHLDISFKAFLQPLGVEGMGKLSLKIGVNTGKALDISMSRSMLQS